MTESELWALHSGAILENVHSSKLCEGRGCPIHHPSDHKMRDWRLNWRNDRRLMERICPEHGVGHPDPDDLAYKETFMRPEQVDAESVHGCCGCCYDG